MSEWILQYEDGESIRQKLNSLKNNVDYLTYSGTSQNNYLSSLKDVELSNLEEGDILVYSASTNVWYNTVGSDGIIDFAPNSGLQYVPGTHSGETIYNTLLDPTLTTPSSVGGITAGTTVASLSGKTLVGLIDDLLFPTVLPTYTNPTFTLSSNSLSTYEVGVTISPVLTLTCIKNDTGIFTYLSLTRNYNGGGYANIGSTIHPTVANVTAIAPQFGYTDPNNPNYSYSFVFTDSNLIIPSTVSVSASSVIYGGTSIYLSGLIKKNNKGVDDSRLYAVRSISNPQSGSNTLTPSTLTISGWYPYFYGKSVTSVTPAQVVNIIQSGLGFTKVVASGANTLTMNFNAVGEWCWFAIYSPFTTKNKWYENPLNTGNIGSVTDLFSAPTTLIVNSPNGYWSGINFKIYVCQKVTTLGICQIS